MKKIETRFLEVITAYYRLITTNLRNYSFEGKEIGIDIFIIDFLGKNPGASMTKLASFLDIIPSTATKRIDHLVDFGFVIRSSSKKDRRVVKIKLTKSGERLYENFLQNCLFTLDKIMEHFKEEELTSFLSIIERLMKLREEMVPIFNQN
ncbi:MAG: MarR family winged helix-turn-helix transcriptional regulator [Candidatus Thorarchaeota archaeon]